MHRSGGLQTIARPAVTFELPSASGALTMSCPVRGCPARTATLACPKAGTMTGPFCDLHLSGPYRSASTVESCARPPGNAWSHSWSEVGSSRVAVDVESVIVQVKRLVRARVYAGSGSRNA